MKNLNLSTKQVETINHNHIHNVDKLYRMNAGISSRLLSVINGIALLEIEIHSGWKKSNEVTARQFIESWRNFNPDLKGMDGWEVRIYTSEKIAGFTIHSNEGDSIRTQQKIDQMNSDPERYLVLVYKLYSDNIRLPIITLKDSKNKFNLEFATQVEVVKIGFFNFKDRCNYVIYNSNISENLFIIPHTNDDYLLITVAEYGNVPEIKHLNASTTPVTYSLHGNLFYLVNLSMESSALLYWNDRLTNDNKDGLNIGMRNC